MHEVPQNLLGPIQDFEKAFTVDKSKLKEIVNHFVKELEKGMLLICSSPTYRISRTNKQHRFDCRGWQHCENPVSRYQLNDC